MLGIVTEKVAPHVDHEDHRIEHIQGGSNDGMPESLRVDLAWARRHIYRHASCNANQDAGGEIEQNDGRREGHNVSNSLGEVEHQEQIANKATDQGGYIKGRAPATISSWPHTIAG